MLNPFELKPIKMLDAVMDWKTVYPKKYNKYEINPYTRIRAILMNGVEAEAAAFLHQFHRHCADNDLRRELAIDRKSVV